MNKVVGVSPAGLRIMAPVNDSSGAENVVDLVYSDLGFPRFLFLSTQLYIQKRHRVSPTFVTSCSLLSFNLECRLNDKHLTFSLLLEFEKRKEETNLRQQ